MTKKLFVIIMGLILMLSCFTACSTKTEDKEKSQQESTETTKNTATEDYTFTWHDLKMDLGSGIAREIDGKQLNIAVDGYMVTAYYLEDGGEITDSNKSLRKYVDSFEGTTDETSEVEINKTKVGVANFTTKDGIKGKLYLFTLKNKNAYSVCSTYHKGDDKANTKSIEILDNTMKNISWVNSTKKPVEPKEEEDPSANINKDKDIEYSFTYSIPEGYTEDKGSEFISYGSRSNAYSNTENFDKDDINSLKMLFVNMDGFCNSEENWSLRTSSDALKDVKEYTTKNGIKGKMYQTDITEYYGFSFYNKGECTIAATNKEDLIKVLDTLKLK